MIFYYAGSGSKNSNPEVIFAKEKNLGVMLTYFEIFYKRGSTCKRWKRLRKRNRKEKK